MNFLIVGDIHGCLNTFKKLLNKYWNKENEMLIQVGDLIDRGNFSTQTFLYAYDLIQENKYNTCFLKGNHEFEMLQHFTNGPNNNWLRQGGDITLKQFQETEININHYLKWINQLPLKWENEKLLVTHAGISSEIENPFDEVNKKGVLWNRGTVKNIGKFQIFGHTPTKNYKPVHDKDSNSLNIDSGAYLNFGLSAVKISESGKILQLINIPTDKDDIKISDR